MPDAAIHIRVMSISEADQIGGIDRSEWIEATYRMVNGQLERSDAGHECSTWSAEQVKALITRFKEEVGRGGYAVGAYHESHLVGFGVLGHKLRGSNSDQVHVDLLYVSRNYRRRGTGTRIMVELEKVARARGAAFLYISSTETQSAVGFYSHYGSELAGQADPELYALEPNDIHMLKKL
ncbi:GNAT family N-acetyltransferase [Paenibacillus cymbidii]|uniref:GNAT family N-acetyltransferase n=1 Tax=Paenibacillus cymbidii TaxID=1639034 RepID=UPI001A9BDAD8|nr:GNAT family N-acetyltransferase [Paenibacillus cymbidii]